MMSGELRAGEPAGLWNGAAIDSRRIRGGELFFALRGTRTDGHRFVADAIRGGAAAVVVDQAIEPSPGAGVIRVEETLAALHALTRKLRDRAARRLLAITGSMGKTTTKELTAAVLAERFSVIKSPGNLNNLYGFPLALLNAGEDNDWMVAEMGMSTPGELRQLSVMARPDVALFTNVRPVHLEFFASVEEIAEAKAELLVGVQADGLVVANADDPAVLRIAGRFPGRVIRYGLATEADVRAEAITVPGDRTGTDFELVSEQGRQAIHLPLHGRYNVHNALAAAAAGLAFGVSPGDVAHALAHVSPAEGRGIVHHLGGGAVLIDDSYNSNPEAVRRALEAAAELPGRRHWAVLGDMLELGPRWPVFHRVAGRVAKDLGFAPLFAVGELAKELAGGANAASTRWFADAESAIEPVLAEVRPGDVVLIKGSRGVGLDCLVQALLEARGEE